MKENMYYGAGPLIFQRAEELRNRMTPAEEILWKHIHINKWKLKFRRQHPIANYIADFYCHGIKLVIEIDGGIHNVEEVKLLDEERENHLKELGLTVLRFKNEEIFSSINSVLDKIDKTVRNLQGTPLGDGGVSLYVIKIGGNIIDNEIKLTSFLTSFTKIESPKILVHGGGKLATQLAERLNIPQQMVEGRRITDAETLKIATMVYAGYINKNIVARLQALNCNSIGLSGADGNTILAHKRQHPTLDYGYVGDIDVVNSHLLTHFLDANMAPVIAPITSDKKGQLLNTNADTIAQEIAKALSGLYEVELIFTFEKSGVLLDINDEKSIIKKLTPSEYELLKIPPLEGGGAAIFSGMIPKLDNAFAALNNGVKKVRIGKAEELEQLIAGKTGTLVTHEP